MKLDFNLQVAQKQGLTLTAQVQQAIKLLHMTNMEIQEFVADQFQDNPFIETNAQSEENLNVASHTSDNKDLDKSLSDNPYNEAAKSNSLTQENQFETGESYIPKSTVSKAALDFDTISLVAEESKSLYAHCLDFINSLRLSHLDFIIAQRILEDLEPTGWLTGELDEIAKELNIEYISEATKNDSKAATILKIDKNENENGITTFKFLKENDQAAITGALPTLVEMLLRHINDTYTNNLSFLNIEMFDLFRKYTEKSAIKNW